MYIGKLYPLLVFTPKSNVTADIKEETKKDKKGEKKSYSPTANINLYCQKVYKSCNKKTEQREDEIWERYGSLGEKFRKERNKITFLL